MAINAVASASADVAGKLATFAYTVLAVRVLSQEDYGAFAYAISLALLVSAVPAWGWDVVLVQRGAVDPRRLPRLLGDVLVWKTVVGVPLFAAVGLWAGLTRPGREAQVALALVLAATLLDAFDQSNRNAAGAVQRLGGASAALVLQRLLTAALAAAALLAGLGLVGLAGAYLVGSAAGSAVIVVARRRLGIRADLRGVTTGGLRAATHGTLWVGLLSLVAMALFRFDAVMIEALRGDAEVATYTAAYRLVETVLFVAWAIGRAVFPVMSAAEVGEAVRQAAEQGLAAVAAVYLPFAVLVGVLATPLLEVLYGASYAAQATGTLRWLAAAPVAFSFAYLLGQVLLSRRHGRAALAGATIAMVLNIAINLVLIRRLGGEGAAVATTASYLVQVAALRHRCARLGVAPRLLRAAAEPLLASAVLGAVVGLLPLPVLVRALLGATAYAAVWAGLVVRSSAPHLDLVRALLPFARRR